MQNQGFTNTLFLTIQRNYLFQKIMSTTLKNTLNLEQLNNISKIFLGEKKLSKFFKIEN